MIETIFRVTLLLVVVSIVLAVLNSLAITINLPFQFGSLLSSFLNVATYILPFKKLLPLFAVVVSMSVFKVTVAILKTVWDLLPIRA